VPKSSAIGEEKTTSDFEADLKAVAHRLRSSILGLMASVNQDVSNPQAIARQFGLDKNLTWKISKVVQESDAFAALAHFPGQASVRALLKAFERAGATESSVRAMRQAAADFDHIVRVHSGDRVTLDMMLDNLVAERRHERMEIHRRTLYRGLSATWGVQARLQLCVNVVAPSDDPDWVDVAWLSGLVELRRLRRDTPWAIASVGKFADDGSPLPVGTLEALDPRFNGPDTAPLLGDFCSKPLPDIRPAPPAGNMVRYQLVQGQVGKLAAVSCIIGLKGRSLVRRTKAENYTCGEHGARLYTPAELLIHDLYVHRDLRYAMSPELAVYSHMPGGLMYPGCEPGQGLLPVGDPVVSLGSQPPDVLTPEFPRYSKMIHYVFERSGWDMHDFAGFRVKLPYPPIPALAVLRYPLPEPGAET
jgi:hypothetical protein